MNFYKIAAGVLLGINFAAFSSSNNYQLKSYGVNSGGTNSSSSSTYKLQAGTGELGGNVSGSATYQTKSGSIEAQQANVPGAPTLSNGGGTYSNKIGFVVNTQNNPSDTNYVVAVSTTSNFASTLYVQADGTLGSGQVWQTYSQWGSGTGTFAIGLTPSTTYYFKMAAMQGLYTATGFGPSANSTTSSSTGPTLSFSVSPSSINMGNLPAGSVVSSPSTISLTFDTNATFGGNIYMAGSSTGLVSAAAGGYNIHVTGSSADLSSVSEGFGFQALSASSPLSIQSPYNVSSNNVGAIYTTFQPVYASTSSVSSGTATGTLKAKAAVTTPAANDYANTLTFVAAASY